MLPNCFCFFSCKVLSYLFNIAGWNVAISLALVTLYGGYKAVRENPEPFSRTENITYGTFSRYAWSLALAWVIFACHRGLGGKNKRLCEMFDVCDTEDSLSKTIILWLLCLVLLQGEDNNFHKSGSSLPFSRLIEASRGEMEGTKLLRSRVNDALLAVSYSYSRRAVVLTYNKLQLKPYRMKK